MQSEQKLEIFACRASRDFALKVIEENADLTSENTYSWTLNQKTREKYMYITINKSAKLNRGTTIVLVVLVVAIALTAIIIVKRLSESKKILGLLQKIQLTI